MGPYNARTNGQKGGLRKRVRTLPQICVKDLQAKRFDKFDAHLLEFSLIATDAQWDKGIQFIEKQIH